MSKPGSLSKTDLIHWIRTFAAYLFGSLLAGLGITLQHLNFGIWTYLLIAVGGALADLGRRFVADTENQLVTQTQTTTTLTSNDPLVVDPASVAAIKDAPELP